MRARHVLAIGLATVGLAGPLHAADQPFGAAVSAETLDDQRGGTDTTVTDSLVQGNATSQSSTNNGDVTLAANSAKLSGTISAATITGNSGMITVLQNTGDQVNMSNATSVNVYMR